MNLGLENNAPFTDEQIRNLTLDFSNDVCVVIDVRDLPNLYGITVKPVFVVSTISPKLHNLILAAPHLYRALSHNWRMLECLRNVVDEVNVLFEKSLGEKIGGLAQLEQMMSELQDFNMTFMRTATEGPDKVAKELSGAIDI